MAVHQFYFKWKNHANNLLNVFAKHFSNESFTDVTLVAEGRSIRAHKMVLSACSSYFEQLFLEHHADIECFPRPIIVVMRETSFQDLSFILDFMYKGDIKVSQHQLESLLKTAESLRVKGLSQENKADANFDHSSKTRKDCAESPSRKRCRIPSNNSTNDQEHIDCLSDCSKTSSTTFSPRIDKVVSMEPQRKINKNDNYAPIRRKCTERIILEPDLTEREPIENLQDSSTTSNSVNDQHPKVKLEQSDEPARFFRGHIIHKFNDYIAHCQGSRQQYWVEPFTQAVMDGIQNRELDLRKGAKLLGVSYSTLYGRYNYIQTY